MTALFICVSSTAERLPGKRRVLQEEQEEEQQMKRERWTRPAPRWALSEHARLEIAQGTSHTKLMAPPSD